MSKEHPELVLASGSPRRRELLDGLGLTFAVRPVDLDEMLRDGESPEGAAVRLAREKARLLGDEASLVLAADTLVVCDGEALGKPRDPTDARSMLRRLAGREHEVLTAVAVRHARRERAGLERTRVRLRSLSDEEIDWYVATGEPADKAGAYAIQGLASLFVESLEGNYSNVVGLPIPLVHRLVREMGWELREWRTP